MANTVPSHGLSCDVVRCFPMDCPNCGMRVVFYECVDGSRVFLEPPDRGKHICNGPPKPSRINRRTGGIIAPQKCGVCGRVVSSSKWLSHMQQHFAS